jgi:hypothetical protein
MNNGIANKYQDPRSKSVNYEANANNLYKKANTTRNSDINQSKDNSQLLRKDSLTERGGNNKIDQSVLLKNYDHPVVVKKNNIVNTNNSVVRKKYSNLPTTSQTPTNLSMNSNS